MKAKTQFTCQQCGHSSLKWIGRCPSCQQWNTLVEEPVSQSVVEIPTWDSVPTPFEKITGLENPRIRTNLEEFDRVLGGGVVPGALVLLGGDPGVGKSTLMLDVAARLSTVGCVLYSSGEESAQQIKLRGDRMRLEAGNLHIYAEMSIEKILTAARQLEARAVVIDSVQTTFSEKIEMAPGSIGQVREITAQLLFWAKKYHTPVFLIGHITKDGSLAGPKSLEHMVDTVLYFEGPRQHPHRIVRAIKNRFGPTHELGIFEMGSLGLKGIDRPSALFLSQTDVLRPGSAVVCCVEGSRPLLVEIQALVSRTHFGTPRRLATGVDPQRMALVCAVLEKRLDVNLWDQDIYLNVVGGLEVDEPAADLAICAAILSSLFNRPLGSSSLVFGEIGLGGEIRPAISPELRLKEASLLGFKRAIIPAQSLGEETAEIAVCKVRNLQEAHEQLFQ